MVLTGCTGTSSPDDPGTGGAEAYVETLHEAWQSSFANLALFGTPDVILDMGSFYARLEGRSAAAQVLRQDWGDTDVRVSADEPVYVSADGALDPTRLEWETYVVPMAPVYRMAPEGIEQMLWSGSVKSGAWYVGLDRVPVDRVADAYLAAWSTGAVDSVADLYSPDAVLIDSLLGLELSGLPAIAGAVGSGSEAGGLPGAAEHQIPADGGRAAYTGRTQVDGVWGPPGRLVLLLDVDDGGCPGAVGVLLSFDDDWLITREERFHRVDAVPQCLDLDGRPVWWDDGATSIPDTIFTHTGTLREGTLWIQLWNASPEREQLLRWALAQDADHLLPPPEPRSVTFVPPGPDPWTAHGFVAGTRDAPLPATADGCPDTGCDVWPSAARAEALTALAHVWLADPARRTIRADYAEEVGSDWISERGADSDQPDIVGPAAHRAAHTVTWGLMDQPYPLPSDIADLSCDALAADFLLLAGTAATGAACAQPGGG